MGRGRPPAYEGVRRGRLLDLFCGAGGAAMGYARYGYEVIGVDIKPQPRYPFKFVQADAMEYPLEGFDMIHASPPCQAHSPLAALHKHKVYPKLIGPVRDRLRASGTPYVIENVPGAPLLNPLVLCGVKFGLGVFRHRLFEVSWPFLQPSHLKHNGYVGDGRYVTVAGHTGWTTGWRDECERAMGIDWMTHAELAQAIPPVYTSYVAATRHRANGRIDVVQG
jgi:DNA (cytosine-5)-methyltransferase 1